MFQMETFMNGKVKKSKWRKFPATIVLKIITSYEQGAKNNKG